MELFTKFKKDYFNYLLSIILPALISGLTIPILKNLLGAEGYGKFSLWYNAILILTALFSAWIAQSILRFFPKSDNKIEFSKKAIRVSLKTQALFCIPIFITVYLISKDLLLSLLFELTLVLSSLQFTVLPILQSAFLSKKIIFSEIIRTCTYVGIAVLMILFIPVFYIYALLLAVSISYLFSLQFMVRAGEPPISKLEKTEINNSNGQLTRKFLKYGAPLSMWFMFSYLLTYSDKLFVYFFFGASAQGNYQAMFDLINKSLSLIISPVVTSLFPLLIAAYEKGSRNEIRVFMKKILIYELGAFLIVGISYWFFGAKILFYILDIPKTSTYLWMGFIVICATFIWQLSLLTHKRFELKMRSLSMLKMVIFAFSVQIIFYFAFKNTQNLLIAPLGYLIASIIYLYLTARTESVLALRSIFSKPGKKKI